MPQMPTGRIEGPALTNSVTLPSPSVYQATVPPVLRISRWSTFIVVA